MVKRIVDMAVASLLLVVLAPVIGIVALLVHRKLGVPVLFRQARPGHHGILFELVKFRSMSDARKPDGSVASDRHRMTSFGGWLRATSLDELPTLWNVLRGDMSLVGPRPLLPEYLELYDREQSRRHDVRPGITGWAQVHGRNHLGWEERFRLDVWYVDNRTLTLDLKILWRSVVTVIGQDGINHLDDVGMPRFTGNAESGLTAVRDSDHEP